MIAFLILLGLGLFGGYLGFALGVVYAAGKLMRPGDSLRVAGIEVASRGPGI